MKRRDDLRDVPVVVITTMEDERKAMALGADAFCLKPVERCQLLHMLTRLAAPCALRRILIVDDEEIDPETAGIPVVIVTAQPIDDDVRRNLMPAAALRPKQGISRARALATIEAAIRGESAS